MNPLHLVVIETRSISYLGSYLSKQSKTELKLPKNRSTIFPGAVVLISSTFFLFLSQFFVQTLKILPHLPHQSKTPYQNSIFLPH